MQKNRIRLTALILITALLISLLASGCSSSDEQEETTEAATEAETEEETTEEETETEEEEEEEVDYTEYMTLGDYSVITVDSADLEVTDEEIQNELDTMTDTYSSDDTTYALTDGFVKINSLEYWGEQIDTVEELEAYVEEYLYTENLHTAMINALLDLQTLSSKYEDTYDTFYDYAVTEVEYYASYYSVDTDTFAQEYGYEDTDDYVTDEALGYYKSYILVNYLWQELGFDPYTEDELNAEITAYMEKYQYDEYFDLDEFLTASGDAWIIIYETLRCKYTIVMEALEDRVEFE